MWLYSFFNLGARGEGLMVNATSQPLYPPGIIRRHCIGGWMGPRAGLDGSGKCRHPLCFDPRTSGRYIDCALPAPTCVYCWYYLWGPLDKTRFERSQSSHGHDSASSLLVSQSVVTMFHECLDSAVNRTVDQTSRVERQACSS